MNVKEFKQILAENPDVALHVMLPNGEFVASHFHITEVGFVHKRFMDCGGTLRELHYCALQVWTANDANHRLNSTKLCKIMRMAAPLLNEEWPLMVEYGGDTISQYPVADVEVTPQGLLFVLGNKPTACLAPDKCGVQGCC